jgi:hypothetical protein
MLKIMTFIYTSVIIKFCLSMVASIGYCLFTNKHLDAEDMNRGKGTLEAWRSKRNVASVLGVSHSKVARIREGF